MYEYRDIMAQLKYPGVSRCMSRIYRAVNMDDVHYSQERRPRQSALQAGITQTTAPQTGMPAYYDRQTHISHYGNFAKD